jgi:hypothetical protein
LHVVMSKHNMELRFMFHVIYFIYGNLYAYETALAAQGNCGEDCNAPRVVIRCNREKFYLVAALPPLFKSLPTLHYIPQTIVMPLFFKRGKN